jgi:hypothetical protein
LHYQKDNNRVVHHLFRSGVSIKDVHSAGIFTTVVFLKPWRSSKKDVLREKKDAR